VDNGPTVSAGLEKGENRQHPAMIVGVLREGEPAQDAADVLVDGALGNPEPAGDAGVGAALRDLRLLGQPVRGQPEVRFDGQGRAAGQGAQGGAEALAWVRDTPVDVARRLTDGGPPVILISTHSGDDFQELIAASPARGYLPKSALSARAIQEVPGEDGTACGACGTAPAE
jgi:hypothetical protein